MKPTLEGDELGPEDSLKENGIQYSVGDGMPVPKIHLHPPGDIKLEWRQVHKIGAGLVNLGNTCFMNTVIQCLTYCPPLANYLLYDNHTAKCKIDEFCMMCELQIHIKRALDRSGDIIKPLCIYQKLKSIAKHFQFGRQEDAHEFLRFVIDRLWKSSLLNHEDLFLDPPSRETTVVNQIFGGYHRSQVVCLKCKEKSNTYDHFMDFILDVKNVSSLEKALEKFVQPELLQNDNAYQCSHCDMKVSAQKRFSIHKAPNVATFQLKRFDFIRVPGGKITKHVAYPEKLDLRPFMSNSKDSSVIYRLNAVLVHLGTNCNSGHYICYVRNSNGHWYLMDDTRVHQVGLKEVLNQQAYVLFYVRSPVRNGYFLKKSMPSLNRNNFKLNRKPNDLVHVAHHATSNGSQHRPYSRSTLSLTTMTSLESHSPSICNGHINGVRGRNPPRLSLPCQQKNSVSHGKDPPLISSRQQDKLLVVSDSTCRTSDSSSLVPYLQDPKQSYHEGGECSNPPRPNSYQVINGMVTERRTKDCQDSSPPHSSSMQQKLKPGVHKPTLRSNCNEMNFVIGNACFDMHQYSIENCSSIANSEMESFQSVHHPSGPSFDDTHAMQYGHDFYTVASDRYIGAYSPYDSVANNENNHLNRAFENSGDVNSSLEPDGIPQCNGFSTLGNGFLSSDRSSCRKRQSFELHWPGYQHQQLPSKFVRQHQNCQPGGIEFYSDVAYPEKEYLQHSFHTSTFSSISSSTKISSPSEYGENNNCQWYPGHEQNFRNTQHNYEENYSTQTKWHSKYRPPQRNSTSWGRKEPRRSLPNDCDGNRGYHLGRNAISGWQSHPWPSPAAFHSLNRPENHHTDLSRQMNGYSDGSQCNGYASEAKNGFVWEDENPYPQPDGKPMKQFNGSCGDNASNLERLNGQNQDLHPPWTFGYVNGVHCKNVSRKRCSEYDNVELKAKHIRESFPASESQSHTHYQRNNHWTWKSPTKYSKFYRPTGQNWDYNSSRHKY